MGNGEIWPTPQNLHPLADHQKICRDPCQIWRKSVHRELLVKWAKYNEIVIYLCLFSGIHLQVRPVDGVSCLKRRGLAQGCAFDSFVNIVPILRVKFPPPQKKSHFCTTMESILTAPNKSKIADGRHLENYYIAISVLPFDRFWWNLARWSILAPYTGPTVQPRCRRYLSNALTNLHGILFFFVCRCKIGLYTAHC